MKHRILWFLGALSLLMAVGCGESSGTGGAGGMAGTGGTGGSSPEFARFAYVTNRNSDDVSQYRIGVDGTLTPLAPATSLVRAEVRAPLRPQHVTPTQTSSKLLHQWHSIGQQAVRVKTRRQCPVFLPS